MDVLFLLVPLSVLLALAVMGVLAWAVWSGQFEELDTEGERILAAQPLAQLQQSADTSSASLIHINSIKAGEPHTSA